MKNKYWVYLLIALVIGIFVSCEDFTEEDLNESYLELLAPSDGNVTESMVQTFFWREMYGADNYNLQVVSPSYDTIDKLVLDTNITGRLFKYTLFEGRFQWRVVANNFSSSTISDTFSLEVIKTTEIDEVALISPSNNSVLNSDDITFSWEKHPNANRYILYIRKDDWDNETNQITDTTTSTSTSISLDDGDYFWGVEGRNDTIKSKLISPRSLIVDKTDPEVPLNMDPEDTDTIKVTGQQYTLTWDRTTNDIVVKDSIYIYEDASQTILKVKAACTNAEYNFENIDNNTKYYWKLKSFDHADNASDFTSLLEFFAEYE